MGEYDARTRLAIDKKRKEEQGKRIGKLGGEDKLLAQDLVGASAARGAHITQTVAQFYGTSEALSKWFKARRLTEEFVPEAYRESFWYIIDKLNQSPFSPNPPAS